MDISVIIPTRNAGKYLNISLDLLNKQSIAVNEILVIDTESRDDTLEICKQYSNINVIQVKQSEFNHGTTRNIAAKHSKGKYLIFLTQDAIPQNEKFIENLLKPFENSQVAAIYGRQIARNDATPMERFSRHFNYPEEDTTKSKKDLEVLGIKAFFFTNVCSAFRREDFDNIGGFQNDIILNEDMIIASKLILSGKLISYASTATVIHSHSYTFRQQFGRYFDIGVSLKMNRYILEYSKVEKEGNKFLIEAIKFFVKSLKLNCAVKIVIESIFKFAGFKLGLNYNLFSKSMVRDFSMHKNYWDRAQI